MASSKSATRTLTLDQARQQLDEILRLAAQDNTRAVIEEDGRPITAIVSAADYEQLEQEEARRREGFKVMAQLGEAFMDVPIEELEREVAKAVQEVREDKRRKQQEASSDE